ncbi:MAG: hypothetical protein KJZ65_12485 [Phycisphaerales bacterium]|nr:hypothetical protein [Phycisphaerales bacterium]
MLCHARVAMWILCLLQLGAPAVAEQAPLPAWALAESPYQLEVTILSVEEKKQDARTTNVWHRVRVERVFAGDRLKSGDETAVVSQVFRNSPGTTGSSGDRGPFKGLNGLPVKGDRARLFAGGSASTLKTRSPNGWQNAERTISFVAADDEYRSEVTMPFLAGLVEASKIGLTRVHFATGDDGRGSSGDKPDLSQRTGLTDDSQLRFADAAVLFMRFRELHGNSLTNFEAAAMHGLPLVGFRTSTHAFRYPDGPGAKRWNDDFPVETFGTGWKFHHGHKSTTRILPPDAGAQEHAILAGIEIPTEGVVVPSWLYHVEPLPPDCRVLLWGEALESESPGAPQRQPLLWVRERPRKQGLPPQRIAFTTLGHPGDFANPTVRVLTVQMIAWAIGEEERMGDAARTAIGSAEFDAPPTN